MFDLAHGSGHGTRLVQSLLTVLALIFFCSAATAQETDGAAELAAQLQDPLANLAALMTDNTLGLRTGENNDETYEINLQPVYSIPIEKLDITLVPRAMIPFVSVKPGSDLPRLSDDGDETISPANRDREMGLSDIVTQFFITPMGQGDVKWGGGPMVSLRTRTDDDVAGAGWGSGLVGVLVGEIGPIGGAILGGHLWGFDGDFSTSFVQPMAYYNFESIPGAYFGYNNTISFDHKNKGSTQDSWTIPLGLMGGRTFDMGDGHGFDISLGAYHLPSWGRTRGGSEHQIKLGLSWIFPR